MPPSSDTSSGSAPASSSACHGRSSSTCSTPSVASTATFIPFSSPAMQPPLPGAPTGHTPAHYGSGRVRPHPPVWTVTPSRVAAASSCADGLRASPSSTRRAPVALSTAGHRADDLIARLVRRAGLAAALRADAARRPARCRRRAAALAAAAGPVRGACRGPPAAVDDLAGRPPGRAGRRPRGGADAEARCRALAGRRVRLVAGARPAADLAFVRCLNVLMAGDGRPGVAASGSATDRHRR